MKKTLSKNEFLYKLEQIHFNKISIISDYKNCQEKIDVKCNICNNMWSVKASHLIHSKSGCPKCNYIKSHNNQVKSKENFIKDVFKIHGDKIILLDDYYNVKTKLNVKCNICNNTWLVSPNSLLNGHGCSCCKKSKGEKIIEKYLIDNNVLYKKQYVIDGCKNKHNLYFDFAVFENNNLYFLIEFDGIQHFKPIKYFGGIEKFKYTKKTDKIKDDYCKNNNIKLIRIPYNKINNLKSLIKFKK